MDEDIEILDIFDNKKKENKTEIKEEKQIISNNKPNKPKKRKLKVKTIQIAFCSLSALFILGCLIFYGLRFIKYYKIYNPKVEDGEVNGLLARDIAGKSEIVYEGNGLYISSGNYLYKGDVNNNYLKYNNMLWRIIKINVDNTIEVILDDYLNILPWNNEVSSFENSEILEYLNNDFLKTLNKDYLTKVNYCEDKISSLDNITCTSHNNDSFVKLLDVTSFLNSIKDKKTYLTKQDEIFWLSNYSDEKVWHTNDINVSLSDSNVFYEIRPVIKLKNTIKYLGGDGTKEKPYQIDENKLTVGSIVKLQDDEWIVYDISDNVKLIKANVLEKSSIFDKKQLSYDESSLKEYLNGEYLDSLPYKDKLVSENWYIGSYENKISDIKKKKDNAKVGIPNILDLHFNSDIKGYFTSTNYEEVIWVYENPLKPSKITTNRSIRPCIAISKEYANSLKENNGIFVDK